jgi:hypothetical protein
MSSNESVAEIVSGRNHSSESGEINFTVAETCEDGNRTIAE